MNAGNRPMGAPSDILKFKTGALVDCRLPSMG